MDLSGQPHALATLPLADKAPLPIEHEAGWVQELVRMFWRRNFLFLLGIEPWIVQPIAWSLHQLCYTSLCSYRQINVSNMLAVCISSSITITNCIYQNVELAIFHNSSFLNRRFTLQSHTNLTLTLLMWRIWWAPNNASRWQIGFNLAFKGLIALCINHYILQCQFCNSVMPHYCTEVIYKSLNIYVCKVNIILQIVKYDLC